MTTFGPDEIGLADKSSCAGIRADLKMCLLESECCRKVLNVSIMNKEKLIEEVRRYPYLYDASDAKYADSVKRDQTWKSIARTLSATGEKDTSPVHSGRKSIRMFSSETKFFRMQEVTVG